MTTYVIGDVQGCLKPLKYLLAEVGFNKSRDKLWLVGDVVNRGPQSLGVLHKLYKMQDCVNLVLGNHDLHLLACNLNPQLLKPKDTLMPILKDKFCAKLLGWLQNQPLMRFYAKKNIALVHAGILPLWDLKQAQFYADQVHFALKDKKLSYKFLRGLYGDENDVNLLSKPASNNKQKLAQLRFITNVFTRMRFCNEFGMLDLKHKGSADNAPLNFAPWFSFKRPNEANTKIIFGHWAALEGKCNEPNYFALDTGYIWGGTMTMLNLDNFEKITCAQLD